MALLGCDLFSINIISQKSHRPHRWGGNLNGQERNLGTRLVGWMRDVNLSMKKYCHHNNSMTGVVALKNKNISLGVCWQSFDYTIIHFKITPRNVALSTKSIIFSKEWAVTVVLVSKF